MKQKQKFQVTFKIFSKKELVTKKVEGCYKLAALLANLSAQVGTYTIISVHELEEKEPKKLYKHYAVGCDVDAMLDEGRTCEEVLEWFKSDEAREAYEDEYNEKLLLETAAAVIESHRADGLIGKDGKWIVCE